MKFIFLLLFTCLIKVTYSQDITGTWTGYFKLNTKYSRDVRRDYHSLDKDSLFMHMEIKQDGRDVNCVFYYAKKEKQKRPIAAYRASALLDKKHPLDFFKILRDGIVEDNTKSQWAIRYFKLMEATYQKSDNDEFLYGNYYDNDGRPYVYWIKKINNNIGPRLQQILDSKKKN